MGDKLSAEKMASVVRNPLVHGRHSEFFNNWCKSHGFDISKLDPYSPQFIEQVGIKLAALNEYSERTKVYLEFYKCTGARGLTMLDKLVNLQVQILEREKNLISEGLDPLEDRSLMAAKRMEFEIVQFLEKIKYDKEKTDKTLGIIDIKKADEEIDFINERLCNTQN